MKYHDQSQNVKPLPELTPGQKVLFLSHKQQNQCIEGTVTTKASTPRSYFAESQGKTYCHTCQHICTINIDIPDSQDHQQEHIPVSEDHHQEIVPISQDQQQSHHHKNIPVSQDHCHNNVPVSQDHCHKNIPVPQDNHHNNVPVSQDPHIKNVPISQDHQLRYTQRKSVKPASKRHHHHSTGSNQQLDMSVSNPITAPQSETTTDQILQYLVAINGHNAIQPPLAIQNVTPTPVTPSTTTSQQPLTCSSKASPKYNTEEDTTTSDDEYITSIASDRQLRPHVPISYNETVLNVYMENNKSHQNT